MSLHSFNEYVLTLCDQENAGLEQELQAVKLQLTEAQNSVSRLQNDLDQLLNDKVLLWPRLPNIHQKKMPKIKIVAPKLNRMDQCNTHTKTSTPSKVSGGSLYY